MFKTMRRQDRSIEMNEINSILTNGEYGILTTLSENGYPYGVPVSYVSIENAIYIHCADTGEKLDNIAANNKVSFTVVGKTEVLPNKFSTNYESVIGFGKASLIESRDEKIQFLKAFIHKYSQGHEPAGFKYVEHDEHKTKVIKIEFDHITGKARR